MIPFLLRVAEKCGQFSPKPSSRSRMDVHITDLRSKGPEKRLLIHWPLNVLESCLLYGPVWAPGLSLKRMMSSSCRLEIFQVENSASWPFNSTAPLAKKITNFLKGDNLRDQTRWSRLTDVRTEAQRETMSHSEIGSGGTQNPTVTLSWLLHSMLSMNIPWFVSYFTLASLKFTAFCSYPFLLHWWPPLGSIHIFLPGNGLQGSVMEDETRQEWNST